MTKIVWTFKSVQSMKHQKSIGTYDRSWFKINYINCYFSSAKPGRRQKSVWDVTLHPRQHIQSANLYILKPCWQLLTT